LGCFIFSGRTSVVILDVVMPCYVTPPQTYLSGQLWKCASNNLMKLAWPLLKDEKDCVRVCMRERERETGSFKHNWSVRESLREREREER